MNGKFKRRRLAILEVLRHHEGSVISHDIAYELNQRGADVSERTIRLDLQEMDRQGVTLNVGRRGRQLTAAGLAELHLARTHERIGFLSSKIDAMTYAMTFDLDRCAGEVVVNTTLCTPDQLRGSLGEIAAVFAKGYGMGQLVCLAEPGERIGEIDVPTRMIGFCTVCSITLNGILLKHGIPVQSLHLVARGARTHVDRQKRARRRPRDPVCHGLPFARRAARSARGHAAAIRHRNTTVRQGKPGRQYFLKFR